MAATIATEAPARAAKPWYKVLYLQVLIAILLGVVVGWLWPNLATNDWIKALGDGFIKLIKMVIAPIIFCTVVSGIAHIQDAKKVGRVGIKALVYFEVVVVRADPRPGGGQSGSGRSRARRQARCRGGRNLRQAGGSAKVGRFRPQHHSGQRGRRARAGDILQVLLFAILFGFALMALGERGTGCATSSTTPRMRCSA